MMKKIKLNYIAFSLIILTAISCENESVETDQKANLYEGLSPEIISKIKEVERIVPQEDYKILGFKNAKELVLSGAEITEYIPTKEDEKAMADLNKKMEQDSKNAASKASSSRLTMDQLRQMAWTDHDIISLYTLDDRKPDGFNMNGHRTSAGISDLHTRYNWYADVTIGQPKFKNRKYNLGFKTLYSTWAKNLSYTSTDVAELAIQTTIGNERNWNVTGNVSFSVGGSVGVPFVASGTVQMTVGLSAGGGGSTSNTTSVNRRYEGQVPPRKKRKIEWRQTQAKGDQDYEIPITITGTIGTNFGRRTQGHFFWGQEASRLQKGNQSMTGHQSFLQNGNDGYFIAYAPVPL